MHSRFRFLALTCAGMLATVCAPVSADTVVVDGQPDNPGVSYQKLSGAVAWANTAPNGPHTINVTANHNDNVQVVINAPMTINGDPGGTGAKADILVGVAGIATVATHCYIEIRTPGLVTISDLKLHPNGETGTPANQPDGIRMYEPANSGEVGTYILNRVWLSGTTATGGTFIDPATGNVIWDAANPKRWSPTKANADTNLNAVIQTFDNGAGTINVELNNCAAALGKSNALNIKSKGGTTKVTGGLYGHVTRDGILIQGDGVTLTGSPTNRLRVIRPTNASGSDAHGVEINDATVELMEYVDVGGQVTSQNFKFSATTAGRVKIMRFCRGLGKLPSAIAANNPTVLANGPFTIDLMENCTFYGSAGSATTIHPFRTDSPIGGNGITIKNCIFASEGLGQVLAYNADAVGGVISMENCALPNAGTGEALGDPAVTAAVGETLNFTPTGTVTAAPMFMQMADAYDWSEAAVSVDGSDPNAGNPKVLRPGNSAFYTAAASGGSNLVGGAGGTEVPVTVSGFTID